MECLLMLFKDTGDRVQSVIARPQDRHLRDGEMLPGNQCQQRRRNRTENLRDENNVFATDAIGQMSGRQRKTDDWNREYEPDQPERSRRMRAPVNFPFHRDCEHLSTADRQQISSREKTKPARAERGIRIMSRRRRNDHARNFRSLTDRRFVFVRHTRAHSLAFEIRPRKCRVPATGRNHFARHATGTRRPAREASSADVFNLVEFEVASGSGALHLRRTTLRKSRPQVRKKNWLFFGSQHKHCNYFYDEFEKMKTDGFLTRL